MSGIAGIFNLDGAPVDRAWLKKMAEFLSSRGPDGSEVWNDASAGLCHTLLRTSSERHSEFQPCTIDGQVWIATDARIDDRDTLIAKLQSHVRQDLRAANSAQLILHAYARWGEECVEHLLGDFAFILWDASRRRVFCARDHLGIKPLYYAQVGRCLLVSNTLDCLRQLAVVPKAVNDQAVADFLMFAMNREADTTFFSAIRRLPAAHRLLASPEGFRLEKFWDLPIDEPLYLRTSGEYVERFWDLLHTAMRDRLPCGNLGISMSGGVDSPALAAAAVELGATPVAITTVTDAMDPERIYAGSVARHLRIPIYFRNLQDEPHGWPPGDRPIPTAEPVANVLTLSSSWTWPSDFSAQPRVILYGEGPDNALAYEWRPYLAYLCRHRRRGRLVCDVARHMAVHRRIPLLSTVPRMWRERNNPTMVFPPWLNAELIARLELKKRWDEFQRGAPPLHRVRPVSDGSFRDVIWPAAHEAMDASSASMRFEFRQPFLDLRLLRFFLAVPSMPWCRRKHLLRQALRGRLPAEVLRRPKTPIRGSFNAERARGIEMPSWRPTASLSRYVDWTLVRTASTGNWVEYDLNMRAIGLHYWLLGLQLT